jgi:hypothetical protein
MAGAVLDIHVHYLLESGKQRHTVSWQLAFGLVKERRHLLASSTMPTPAVATSDHHLYCTPA